MKINKVNIPAVNPYNANKLKVEKTQQQPKAQSDKIEISSEAKQLSEISSYAAERKERVQQLKAEVESGNYKVNPEQLAKNIISFYKQ